jgi:putative pyruvate formate lyase activating enzyme
MRIAWAGIHKGEEPGISVENQNGLHGSGTIFFAGCPLGCTFCQNNQLSSRHGQRLGSEVSVQTGAEICLALEDAGAANINLVTGTHVIPSIYEAIRIARAGGLSIPIVWNTSSFESDEGMRLLDGFADVYLADLKWLDDSQSRRYTASSRYAEHALRAIDRFTGTRALIWEAERIVKGVIVRHLVMPSSLENTYEVLKMFSQRWNRKAVLSLMVQYVPVETPDSQPSLCKADYEKLFGYLEELGIEDGFIQETGNESQWIPDFSSINPFPPSYAIPVWHPETGLLRS